jgi:hypothetical protein
LIISVRQEEIAPRETDTYCPIERAFIREGINAAVTGHDVCFFAVDRPAGLTPISECLICLPLPELAKEFVNAFDNHRPVSPIEFDLEIPAAVLEATRA